MSDQTNQFRFSSNGNLLSREKAAPLGESGGAAQLEV